MFLYQQKNKYFVTFTCFSRIYVIVLQTQIKIYRNDNF